MLVLSVFTIYYNSLCLVKDPSYPKIYTYGHTLSLHDAVPSWLTPGTRFRAIRSSRLQEGKGMPAGKTAGSRLRSIVSCFGSLGSIKCAQPMNNVAQNNSAILLYESFGLFMMSLHYRRTCRGHNA